MARNLCILVIFFVLGAGATALVLDLEKAARSEHDYQASVETHESAIAGESPGIVFEPDNSALSLSIKEALELFEVAEGISDWAELERIVIQYSNMTASPRRDGELEVLILRSIDLNPERALQLFHSIPLQSDLLADAYRVWAQTDLDAAVAALSENPDQSFRRRVAIEIFESTGRPLSALQQFSRIVDERSRDGFISQGLIAASLSRPREALESSLAMNDPLIRDQTVRRIAENWAEQDFDSAIDHVRELGDEPAPLRNAFRVGVVRGLALRDPRRALEYISTAEGQQIFSLRCTCTDDVVRLLAGQYPQDLLVASGRVSGAIGDIWRGAAIRSIVDQNLTSALDQIEDVQSLAQRAMWVDAIAATFSRRDPEAALSWIRDERPEDTRRVLSEIARTNPTLAIDFALSNPEYASVINGWLTPQGIWPLGANELSALADRLSGADTTAPATLERLVEAWSEIDPDAAAAWVFRRSEQLGPDIAGRIVTRLEDDLDTLISRLGSAAPAARSELVIAIASDYIQADTVNALRWLQGLRGEPQYDEWISEAARRTTSLTSIHDPERTARMLETAVRPDPDVTSAVAERWARTDPRSAADWSLRLTNSESRSAAIRGSVGAWMTEDPESARRWALSIPRGDVKDVALKAILVLGVDSPRFEHQALLSEFTSQAARSQALDEIATAFSVSAKAKGVDIATLIDDRIADDRFAANVLDRVTTLRLD